jgi:hypothetical protein
MTEQDLEDIIKKKHADLSSVIFPVGTNPAKIRLFVVPDGQDQLSGYHTKLNFIDICMSQSDFDAECRNQQMTAMGFDFTPMWDRVLVHEIVHEYQEKCITTASAAGKLLYISRQGTPAGPKHDETFYTAICEVAPKLGCSATELEKNI